ncbi:hypothetical protein ACFL0T_08135 [Candidatus Omnitrophota bacterium]
MLLRIAKFLLGILFIPVCIAASQSLHYQLSSISIIPHYQKYFFLGIITYLIIHAAVYKPSYLYILGHEIMHVIATWMSFGKVTSFHASPQGGKVTTTKTNFFISLAPYFFPFYTIVVAIIFFAIPLFTKTRPLYEPFLFVIGFTLAFHVILTIDFLKIKQTDLLHTGFLFSLGLIYLVNILVVGLIFSLLFSSVDYIEFVSSIYFKSKSIYIAIWRQLFL